MTKQTNYNWKSFTHPFFRKQCISWQLYQKFKIIILIDGDDEFGGDVL